MRIWLLCCRCHMINDDTQCLFLDFPGDDDQLGRKEGKALVTEGDNLLSRLQLRGLFAVKDSRDQFTSGRSEASKHFAPTKTLSLERLDFGKLRTRRRGRVVPGTECRKPASTHRQLLSPVAANHLNRTKRPHTQ